MESDQLEKLVFQVANLRRQLGNMVRAGVVHEVKGDKLRMVIGRDKDGQDVLGPWLHTSNSMFGGARERRFFKKGQNLTLLCPNGDLTQAMVLPFSPNKKFKAPDHANDTGQDEETYQLDDLRVRKTKNGYAIWLQEPEQEQQQQQQQNVDDHKNETPQKRKQQEPKARSLIQLSNDGGFTARIGKDVRVAAHKDGAKIKAGSTFATVTKDKAVVKSTGDVYVHADGKPYVNKPWEINPAPSDPVSDDDKVLDKSESTST